MNFLIKLGNFFFRWRDTLFSLIFLMGLLILTSPNKLWIFNAVGNLKEDIILSILGFFLILIGILIRSITIGYIYIKRAGINKRIHAEKLFKEGLFAHLRNPLYLGNLFIVTGGIFILNIYLFWFFVLPLFYFIYYCIIKAEEEFLKNKFKEEYQDYLNSVPRLIPRNLSHFPDSFKNLTFSFKRVFKVEHSTHFLVFITIILIHIFKFHFRYNFDWNHSFFLFLYLIGIILIFYQIIMVILKRKGKLNT